MRWKSNFLDFTFEHQLRIINWPETLVDSGHILGKTVEVGNIPRGSTSATRRWSQWRTIPRWTPVSISLTTGTDLGLDPIRGDTTNTGAIPVNGATAISPPGPLCASVPTTATTAAGVPLRADATTTVQPSSPAVATAVTARVRANTTLVHAVAPRLLAPSPVPALLPANRRGGNPSLKRKRDRSADGQVAISVPQATAGGGGEAEGHLHLILVVYKNSTDTPLIFYARDLVEVEEIALIERYLYIQHPEGHWVRLNRDSSASGGQRPVWLTEKDQERYQREVQKWKPIIGRLGK
ncbi:hypothetical protein C8J57DRAFT_1504064 [Mycena rebaudengoi]|nr:hypothetical protein C8J57DRAFT_1504064 [Mycena rebaudengoi]